MVYLGLLSKERGRGKRITKWVFRGRDEKKKREKSSDGLSEQTSPQGSKLEFPVQAEQKLNRVSSRSRRLFTGSDCQTRTKMSFIPNNYQ